MLVITEEMLRAAANKASEALTAYYERDYDPQKPLEIPLEFINRIQGMKKTVNAPDHLPPLHQMVIDKKGGRI